MLRGSSIKSNGMDMHRVVVCIDYKLKPTILFSFGYICIGSVDVEVKKFRKEGEIL